MERDDNESDEGGGERGEHHPAVSVKQRSRPQPKRRRRSEGCEAFGRLHEAAASLKYTRAAASHDHCMRHAQSAASYSLLSSHSDHAGTLDQYSMRCD
jgi:hypothetical protein